MFTKDQLVAGVRSIRDTPPSGQGIATEACVRHIEMLYAELARVSRRGASRATTWTTGQEREYAANVVNNVAPVVLVDIIERREETTLLKAAARAELVRRGPCSECGAAQGCECKPEYGCANSSRITKEAV